jgi:hypothetical protein
MSRAKRRANLHPESDAAMNIARPNVVAEVSDDGVPTVRDIDCIMPTRWKELLPKWEELTDEEKRCRGPFCEALSSIFYSGGRLADHGITINPGIDTAKVNRYIRATLGDFGPKHEHKIGGIAHMLKKWCSHDGRKS